MNNKNPLFEFFEEINLNEKTIGKFIFQMPETELIDFCKCCDDIISIADKSDTNSNFNRYSFIASDHLSGDSSECIEINCRLLRSTQLAQFSALYADKVLVTNPFEKWTNYTSISNYLRTQIINDILVLLINKTLFIKGIFGFKKSNHHYCDECLRKIIKREKVLNSKDKELIKYLGKQISENTEYYIKKDSTSTFIEVHGDESIYEHETSFIHFNKNVDKIFQPYINSGKKVPKKIVEKSWLTERKVSSIYNDYIMQNWYANIYSYNILTSKQIVTKLIDLFNVNKVNIKSPILIPTKSSPDKLLVLREKEGYAFENFRKELSSVMDRIGNNNQNEINDLYSQNIEPELNKIKHTINQNRKTILKDLGKDLLISTGLITVGLYSGILPKDIANLVSTVGGFDLIKSTITQGLNLTAKPIEIQDNPYYFLWRAGQ